MKVYKDFREQSRKQWGTTIEETDTLNCEQLQVGALLRIADAVEKLAAPYDTLRQDRDFQEERAKYAFRQAEKAQRSNNALRGYLKRLKRKAAP